MMQCTKRRSFICGAILSILLLLCSCQVGTGTGTLVRPSNDVPSKDTSQGKAQLLTALNQKYFDRFKIPSHFTQGGDSAAETVLLYLEQNSGGDISRTVELLAENPTDEYGRANCADAVLGKISPSSSETYWVSYALLSADMLDDGALREDADLSPAAGHLLDDKKLLVLADSYSPSNNENAGFAVGVIGGQALVVAVFVS